VRLPCGICLIVSPYQHRKGTKFLIGPERLRQLLNLTRAGDLTAGRREKTKKFNSKKHDGQKKHNSSNFFVPLRAFASKRSKVCGFGSHGESSSFKWTPDCSNATSYCLSFSALPCKGVNWFRRREKSVRCMQGLVTALLKPLWQPEMAMITLSRPK
jgi:hypothetical protein